LLFWILAAYPAQWYWGPEVVVPSLAALALCLGPALATFALAWWGLSQSPQHQLLAVLGGTGLRMFVVLGLAAVLAILVPVLRGPGFWIWLILFYLQTLALEMTLLLLGKPAAANVPRPAARSEGFAQPAGAAQERV
jgi:hypothetical protein